MTTSLSVGQQTDSERDPSDQKRERLAALEALWAAIKDRNGFRLGYNPSVATACDRLREIEREQPATHRAFTRAFTSFCGQCGTRYVSETASRALASAKQCNHQGIHPAMFGGTPLRVKSYGTVVVDAGRLKNALWGGVRHKSQFSAEEVAFCEFSGMAFDAEGYLVNRESCPTGGETIDLQELADRDMGDENDARGGAR